jgi:hypothetical protein
MSTLVLLSAVLLVLVSAMTFGGLAYLAHRHPATREPLLVGLSGMAVVAAIVVPIITR